MQIIAKLVSMMHEELEDAEKYALCSLKEKPLHPKLAQKFNDLAGAEFQHMKTLHSEAERLIQDFREENGEPPAEMLAVYNFEHDKIMKKAAEIKSLIDAFDQ